MKRSQALTKHMSVATAVFRSSELECAGDDSIFSIFGVSLFTLAVSGVGGGQMTFSVSFALFGIIYGALLGTFSVSIGGHSALTNKDRLL